jgi:uncharacterized membrane protein (UPF0127 family)
MHELHLAAARSFWQRTVGLIGHAPLGDNEGMLFERCSSIHTFFMRLPIDVVFIDANGRVVRAVANVKPWRPFVSCAGASGVIELAGGAIARRGIEAGDLLKLGS